MCWILFKFLSAVTIYQNNFDIDRLCGFFWLQKRLRFFFLAHELLIMSNVKHFGFIVFDWIGTWADLCAQCTLTLMLVWHAASLQMELNKRQNFVSCWYYCMISWPITVSITKFAYFNIKSHIFTLLYYVVNYFFYFESMQMVFVCVFIA